ncbi:MAG: SUMF1/EgtB/PvdO family nonheme iron enzyme [Anaerolineales bacterium]|nr:SUMF1/EgtB/PvdO family nonheme iron enzyme [Anaerolineales bacterium]
MPQIFISYSRVDLATVERIVDALARDDLKPWIDWKSIPKGEKFENEIIKGIKESDVFLHLISPNSIHSDWCRREIEYADMIGKRIIPIIIQDTQQSYIHPKIKERNWIFCREGVDDFPKSIEGIQETIQTDFGWVGEHTRLQNKAIEWEKRKDAGRLLRGKDLLEAEHVFAKNNTKTNPKITDIQRTYIFVSRQYQKRLSLFIGGSATVVVFALTFLWLWPSLSRERAIPGEWVLIPAGTFNMGFNNDEAELMNSSCIKLMEPLNKSDQCFTVGTLIKESGRHGQAFLEDFWIMKNEVSNAQYQQCFDDEGCKPTEEWKYPNEDINKPATDLTWKEATQYCLWLGGRLPTQSEWEKASRGPTNQQFPGDQEDLSEINLGGLENGPAPISQFMGDLSGYEVHNLAGNVKEWTASAFAPYPERATGWDLPMSLENISSNMWMVIKGGSADAIWIEGMSAYRGALRAESHFPIVGFRCACPNLEKCKFPWDKKWIWQGEYYLDL